MQVAFGELCRGNGKLFLKAAVSTHQADSMIELTCCTGDGHPLPSRLYTLEQVASNATECVAVVPNMPGKVRLTFSSVDNEHAIKESVTRSINFELSKWESRLNYRFRKDEMADLRDFDVADDYDEITVTFETFIPQENSFTAKGYLTLPYRDATDIEATCLSSNMEKVPIKLILLGESATTIDFIPDMAQRTVPFMIEIPKVSDYFLIELIDKKHPGYESFAVIDPKRFNDMIDDWEDLHRDAGSDPAYPRWFQDRRAKAGDILRQSKVSLASQPTFSIIVPLYKTPLGFFDDMVDSVKEQSYASWELLLVNASPEDEALAQRVAEAAQADGRVKVIPLEENMGISLNTHRGVEAATGDYVCFFDHDDVLTPDALFEYAVAINRDPKIDLLYCDEDKIMLDGKYGAPYFKPDFSIDLLRNNNYICHLLCVRKSLLDTLEPSPKDVDGAQDHDLTLKVAERSQHIHHVPRILYHWRMCEGSTAASTDQKSYATVAGIKAVQRHLDRLGIKAHVEGDIHPFTYRVRYEVEDEPLVSIVIPSKDNADVLDTCLRSILDKTTYPNYEIIIVENNSQAPETFAYYDKISSDHENITVVRYEGEFNFSKVINRGVQESNGQYLLLLNNDTELITPDWLEDLIGVCQREEVGAIGVRLWSPDDTIQHAGVGILGAAAEHLNFGYPRDRTGYFGLTEKPQDLSAVTAACMMVRRDVFESLSGLDEDFAVAYNDVDFCLRIRETGKLVVYWPYVELYHFESLSRGRDTNNAKKTRLHREAAKLNERWAEYYTNGDPYYNVNLFQGNGMYQLEPEIANRRL